MNNLLFINEVFTLARLRRVVFVLTAGLFLLLMTTACSPADSMADASGMDVPEATPEAVNQARNNLSDKAVDENALSRQSPSLAK